MPVDRMPPWASAASTISAGVTQSRGRPGWRRHRSAPCRGCPEQSASGGAARPRRHPPALAGSSIGRSFAQVVDGHAENGQRRLEIVAERRQQRRGQLAACRWISAASRSSRKCARSTAIATTPATASSAPTSNVVAPVTSRPTAFVPWRNGRIESWVGWCRPDHARHTHDAGRRIPGCLAPWRSRRSASGMSILTSSVPP